MVRQIFLVVVSLALGLAWPEVHAWGGCRSFRPSSLLAVLADAKVVVIGTFQNAVKPNNALPEGQVELKIESVLKSHDAVKDRKTLLLPRYIEPGKKYLIAADVTKGEFDPYLGRELDADGEMERFVRGAMQLKDKSLAGRLPYVGPFLFSPNIEVVSAAFADFSDAEYPDLRRVAEKMDAERLHKAIQDAKSPKWLHPTYVYLLGHCGKKEHAVLVRKLLDAVDPDYRGDRGLFAAYVMLDPEAGRKRLMQILAKSDSPFLLRYAAFVAVRQLRENRPDLLNHVQAKSAMVMLLPDPELADFAIEELRRWKCWDACDDVLALVHLQKHQTPIIKKSILRYAMQCPHPQAKAHVIQMQAMDAVWVQGTREWLELETEPQPKQK